MRDGFGLDGPMIEAQVIRAVSAEPVPAAKRLCPSVNHLPLLARVQQKGV
jgi:hypothetical protein